MGRPKGSKNKKKESVSTISKKLGREDDADKKLVEGLAKEEEIEAAFMQSNSPAARKWDALTFEERKEAVQDMINTGFIPTSLKRTVSDLFCSREEENTRFCDLLYHVQSIVSSYFRKR